MVDTNTPSTPATGGTANTGQPGQAVSRPVTDARSAGLAPSPQPARAPVNVEQLAKERLAAKQAAAKSETPAPTAPEKPVGAATAPSEDAGLSLLSATDEELTAKPKTDSEPETPGEEQSVLEKFKGKTKEEVEKAYAELEKRYREKRGTVPEGSYNIAETLQKAGVDKSELLDPVTHKAVYDKWDSLLKDAGVTKEQLGKMDKVYKAVAEETSQSIFKQYGFPPDRSVELQKINQKYGADTKNVLAQVKAFVESGEYPAEVFSRPLNSTAQGVEYIMSLIESRRGRAPLSTPTISPADNADEIATELSAVMRDPRYKRDKGLQKKAAELIARRNNLQGR